MKEKGKRFWKRSKLKRTNWEDLEDVVKFNQINERIKSEFIKLELQIRLDSNLDFAHVSVFLL
jgi:hypothetical protein